jgi:hypothetical protein
VFSFPDLDPTQTKSFNVDSSSGGLYKIISFSELANGHQGSGTTFCSLKYIMSSDSAGLIPYSYNGISMSALSAGILQINIPYQILTTY